MYISGVPFIVLPVKKEGPGKAIELATRPDMYQICGVPALRTNQYPHSLCTNNVNRT
jgi:hypothetical protein